MFALDTNVVIHAMKGIGRVADRLAAEIPGGFQPNQYRNQANPQAHYDSTGPEIWEQTGGQITHLVIGVGTGGTITGCARYLRELRMTVLAQAAQRAASGAEDGAGAPASTAEPANDALEVNGYQLSAATTAALAQPDLM